MDEHVLVIDKYFDATFEQIFELLEKYLDGFEKINPGAGLSVSVDESSGKRVWKGSLSKVTEWGKPNIEFGYIEIIPVFENSISPMQIKMYCSRPEYLGYWSGLSKTIHNHLKISDGSPETNISLWMLVPEKEYDRKLLELWHGDKPAKVIAKRIGISASRVYGRLRELRKKYGVKIVPYKRKGYKKNQ